jgi:hypothetical protein
MQATIPANSTLNVFSEDIRGYKQIKLIVTNENVSWGTATIYGGFADTYTDHSIKSYTIGRGFPATFVIDPGYSWLKLKVINPCFTTAMELEYKLVLA